MNDLISRQAAIDALCDEYCGGWKDCKHYPKCENLKAIQNLCASTQPEIIRCKDCKHRDPEDKKCDCGHDIIWQFPRHDDWYCADAERREDDDRAV